MKKISIPFIALLSFVFQSVSAQSGCSKYYPMAEGTSFEYTNTNKKGKSEGTVSYRVTNVSGTGSAAEATLDIKYIDKKGKEVFNNDYKITCEGDVVKIDYQSLFPSQMMQQYTNMGVEMDITGTDIELPNNLEVGQTLEDAHVAVSMNMSGIKMNITVDQVNRKVEKKESVTTPAGTFDCFLLTETNKSKTMGATQEMQSKVWISEGVGIVKQESYNKKGNLLSRSELTRFSK